MTAQAGCLPATAAGSPPSQEATGVLRYPAEGCLVEWRMCAAIAVGLPAGGASLDFAAASLASGGTSRAERLVILVMWAARIATAAFGTGGIAFCGLGQPEPWCRDHRRRKERVDP
jgi:hypothetical protein